MALATILCLPLCGTGCATDSNKRLFDPSGQCLFSNWNRGTKTVSGGKEKEMLSNTVGSGGTTGSPWAEASNVSQQSAPQITGVNWETQRPNGGILFPKRLPGPGPMIVVEPRSIVAPVGSEIVLVGSYVGKGCEYLRVDQPLEWNLDGTGHFLTTNPGRILHCDLLHTQKVSDQCIKTVTTDKLWRIHRGTSTPADDISILKGQSWVTVQSGAEGTSSVTVLAPNIDNWKNRSTTAQIHWIDALFEFPVSGMAPTGEGRVLTTTVVRRTNPDQPRVNWIVRYEILSGPPAGFGPEMSQTVETATDPSGQAKVILNQRTAAAGSNRVAVKIIRPATASFDRTLVAEHTFMQSWTMNSILGIQLAQQPTVKLNTPTPFRVEAVNLSSTPQDAFVRLDLPPGISYVSSNPKASFNGSTLTWILKSIPAKNKIPIDLVLTVATTAPLTLSPIISPLSQGNAYDPNVIVTPGIVSPGSIPSPSPISTGPATTSPSTVPTVGPVADVKFVLSEPFPASAQINKPFDVIFSLSNPGNRQIDKVMFSVSYPQGVALIVDGNQYRESPTSFLPLPLSEIVKKTFPFSFKAETPGQKTFILRAVDGSNRQVAEYKATVNVVAGTSGSATVSKIPPKIGLTIRSATAGAPAFTVGTTTVLEFVLKNNENYAVSNLVLNLTSHENRSLKPWRLKSSVPSGAVATGGGNGWQLKLPSLPAGREQIMSVTLSPESNVQNGVFSAQLESSAFPDTVIAKNRYVYSIATRRVQRPATPQADSNDHAGQASVIIATPESSDSAAESTHSDSRPKETIGPPTRVDITPLMNAQPSTAANLPVLIKDQTPPSPHEDTVNSVDDDRTNGLPRSSTSERPVPNTSNPPGEEMTNSVHFADSM